MELPLGMRQFAGGDRAVIDEIMIGAGLLDDFPGEGKGSGRGEHHGLAAVIAHSGGGGDVVEAPRLSGQVVGAVAGLEVVVIGTAVESEVSRDAVASPLSEL